MADSTLGMSIARKAAQAAQAAADDSLSFQGLNQLRAAAGADPRSPAAIKAVAQQFEALLMQQLLQTANASALGSDLLGSTGGPMYRSLFDQQVAQTVSQGHGVGLADFLVRELSARYGATANGAATPGAQAAASNAAALPLPARSAAGPLPASAAPTAQNALPAATAAAQPAQASDTSATDRSLLARARDFIAELLPSARTAARALGVTPVAILAQAALETGWGRDTAGNNLFGVKAGSGWSGPSVHALTQEFANGAWSAGQAAFRAYDSVADSVANYTSLLSGARYRDARGHGENISAFAAALQHSGYATDPHYASKLVAVAHSSTMRQALAAAGWDSSSVSE